MAPLGNRKDVTLIGSDIRYIKTNNIQLHKKEHTFYIHSRFIPHCRSINRFLLFIILRRRHIEENKNVSLVKSRKATKMAHKRLELANNHLQTNNKELFYEENFQGALRISE